MNRRIEELVRGTCIMIRADITLLFILQDMQIDIIDD